MAVTDDLGVSGLIPNFGAGNASILFNFITILIFLVVFAVIAGVVGYIIMMRMKYNKKIILFDKVNDKYEVVGRDKGMFMKFGDIGDQIMHFRKLKIYRPKPLKQTGRNTYWYAWVNGELINIEMGDLDSHVYQMGIKIPRQETALGRIGIRKGLADRYANEPWWKKHMGTILTILLMLIFGIIIWLWFDKLIALSNTVNAGVETSNKVVGGLNSLLGKIDNICGNKGYSLANASGVVA